MNIPDIAVVPARDGFDWIRLSLRLFRLQWLRYCSLAAAFILITQFLGALSGGLLAFFLKPILSVGFLAAAWHHERGETPELKHLFAGFRSNLSALLPLGLFYLLGLLLAVTVAVYATGMDLRVIVEAQSSGETKNIDRDTLQNFMLVTALTMLPINGALWFAPALVVFSDAGPFRAIVVSFIACFRNIGALLLYGVALLGVLVVAVIAIAPLLLIIGGNAQSVVVMIALVPLIAIYMISDYVAYRRVFHRSERVQATS
jgi:hypothetical protein